MAKVDGVIVKIGDFVSFKSDYEQTGRVIGIYGERLQLRNESGFGGEYLQYAKETVVETRDCWRE